MKVFAVVAVVVALAFQPGVPKVLHYRQPLPPTTVWVAESAAVDANGDLRTEYFAEHELAMLRRNLARNAAGDCTTFLMQPSLEHQRPEQTLDDVITNSRVIVSGTVTSATPGFFRGLPGTLLALQQTQRLKALVPVSTGETLYVFIPQATIRTRSGALCSTMHDALPAIPEAGASIVAFVYGSPVDEQNAIFEIDPARHLLVQQRGQERVLPNKLSNAIEDKTVGEVVRAVREHKGRTRIPHGDAQ